MLSYGRLALLVSVLALLALFQVALSSSRARAQQDDPPELSRPETPAPALQIPQAAPPEPEPQAPPRPPAHQTVRVKNGKTLQLRARPRGKVVASVGSNTQFGSRTVLSVAETKGNWLGVVSTTQPNNELAWVHKKSAKIDAGRTRWSLHADLSQKALELRRGKRVVKRLRVSIGRPGSSTPTGRFAVTDKIPGTRYGPYYGCCILALNGKQPNLPAGWQGGNRLAIHGTNSTGTIGKAASAGCLRAADSDLRTLMRLVPVGTPVVITR